MNAGPKPRRSQWLSSTVYENGPIPRCNTRIGAPFAQRSSDGFAEVYYQLQKGACPGIDGHVTLHYNRTIFGTDVFLIDVLLQKNSIPMNAHGWSNERKVRWSLQKVSGN